MKLGRRTRLLIQNDHRGLFTDDGEIFGEHET